MTRYEIVEQSHLETLNRAGLALFEKGHVPIIGVNNALPLIAIAGDQAFEVIMMPLSTALASRCDACLRVGGPSKGADQEVQIFKRAGKPIYRSVGRLLPIRMCAAARLCALTIPAAHPVVDFPLSDNQLHLVMANLTIRE